MDKQEKSMESICDQIVAIGEKMDSMGKALQSKINRTYWQLLLLIAFFVGLNIYDRYLQINLKNHERNYANLIAKKDLRDKIAGALAASQFILVSQRGDCITDSAEPNLIRNQKIVRNNYLPELTSRSTSAGNEFSTGVGRQLNSYVNNFEKVENVCLINKNKLTNDLKNQIDTIVLGMNERINEDAKKLGDL